MANKPRPPRPPTAPRTPDPTRIALLAERATNAILLLDAQGMLEWGNGMFTTLTGYEPGEVLGQSPIELLRGPGSDLRAIALMHAAVQDGRGFQMEVLLSDKRGLSFWASFQLEPLIDAAGVPDGFMAMLMDVTAQREGREALRLSRERLALAMAGSGIALWDWDLTSQRVHVNDRWLELLRLTDSEPPRDAAAIEALVHPDDRVSRRAAMEQYLAGAADMFEHEARMRQGDSGWRWVQWRGRVIGWDLDKAPSRMAGTMLDIDASRRAAETMAEATQLAEAANRAKSEFIANMSHEIRTPLNAIIGMTSLLSTTNLDPAQRDYVGTITSSNRALLSLVNDLLDFSRIEAGRFELHAAPFDTWELLESVLEQFTGQAYARGLTLGCTIHRDVPRQVSGDAARLRQVLLNLVGNAVKFTERGRVSLRVRAVPDRPEVLHFEVDDTGIGFDIAGLPDLLEPFRQADGSVTRRFGGSGLGLAISHRLVTLMGGGIRATSVVGRGSCFSFEVPLPALERPALAMPPDVRVSLIGGDADVAQVIHETITALGGRISPAAASGDPSIVEADSELLLLIETDPAALMARLDELASSTARAALLWSPMTDLPLDEFAGRITLLTLPLLPSELVALFDGRDVGAARRERQRLGSERAVSTLGHAKGRVLVVEDNVANQKVARGYLHRLGWAVEIAANGRDALECVQRERYDAILMDCQMPVLNGFVATERIRRLEGTERHTPIIALTAGASTEERARCYECGMDDFLTKPIREDDLDAALTRWALHAGGIGQDQVDRAVLGRLRGLPGEQGGDLIGELLDMLAARVGGVALLMRDEARQGRFDAVMREAHGIKGLALTLGAVTFADRCRDVESAARDAQGDRIPLLVDAFERAWFDALPQLRAARRWILHESETTSPATE